MKKFQQCISSVWTKDGVHGQKFFWIFKKISKPSFTRLTIAFTQIKKKQILNNWIFFIAKQRSIFIFFTCLFCRFLVHGSIFFLSSLFSSRLFFLVVLVVVPSWSSWTQKDDIWVFLKILFSSNVCMNAKEYCEKINELKIWRNEMKKTTKTRISLMYYCWDLDLFICFVFVFLVVFHQYDASIHFIFFQFSSFFSLDDESSKRNFLKILFKTTIIQCYYRCLLSMSKNIVCLFLSPFFCA